MSTQPDVIKHSELLNRLVLDFQTTDTIGRVERLWLDPVAHQVLGFVCKSGWLGRKKQSFIWAEIETIGTDSILVTPQEGARAEKPESVNSIVEHEVWTHAGNKVGKLVDYRFNRLSGEVSDYLFVSNGWRGVTDGIYQLPPVAIASVGRQRVIAIESMVENAEQYVGGLSQKIHQAAEFLKEDYAQTQEDLVAVGQETQSLATQVQDKTQQVSIQAKETFSEVSTQLQEKAQQVSVQAKETFSEASTQLQEKTQQVAEQVTEKLTQMKAKLPNAEPSAATETNTEAVLPEASSEPESTNLTETNH